jgi:hypothetical protein
MKKLLLLIASLLVLVLIAFVVVLMNNKGKDGTQDHGQVTFPTDVGNMTTGSSTQQGGSFLDSSEVHEDSDNPGTYYIGNRLEEGQSVQDYPYLITYLSDTKYFNVVISQEPIGEARVQAERYLMQFLRLTQDQMCALDYTVSVLNSVNSQYAGENIGFSFCPGAVKLPQ